MVQRISLYNKIATPCDLDAPGVMSVATSFCMADNNTAYTVRWMYMGYEHEPGIPPDFGGGFPWPYKAELIKITWDKDACSYSVVYTINNFTSLSGQIMSMGLGGNLLSINHVKYGIRDYIIAIFKITQWRAWDDPTWPWPWPMYGIKVVCYGTDNCDIDINLPWDDDTNFLRPIGVTKPSIRQGKLCTAVDIIENSRVPPEWTFPPACPPTGNPFCPCPTLIIDGANIFWAANVKVDCAGWNAGGDKEYNVNEFHSLGSSAVDPVGLGTYYYTAERVDYETVLLQAYPLTNLVKLYIWRNYPVAHLYNGKKHAYAINDGTGEVFYPDDPGGVVLTTVPIQAIFGASSAIDDKNDDMIWTATVNGIVGKSLVNPALDRVISVEWPHDENPPHAEIAPNPPFAMRILAGEIILLDGDLNLLILKENLPCNYSPYWPE